MAIKPHTLMLSFMLPVPWPPNSVVTFPPVRWEGHQVSLFADAQGRLGFSVEDEGGSRALHVFQRLEVESSGHVQLTFGWGEDGREPMMHFRGKKLALDPKGAEPPLKIDLTSAPKPVPNGRMYADLQPGALANKDDRFFFEVLQDIDSTIVNAPSRYQLMHVAAGLYVLLDDDSPHLTTVNMTRRKRFLFSVLDPKMQPPRFAPTVAHWRNFDPEPFPFGGIVHLKLHQLLDADVLEHNGVTASVRDLIKTCRNAMGGAHYGRAENDRQQAVLNVDEIFGSSPERSSAAIIGLCRVVLRGLKPLVDAIRAEGAGTD